MRKLNWILAAGLIAVLSAGSVVAGPVTGLASGTREAAQSGLVETVKHRRHIPRFHAPYFGIYVSPRHYRHDYRYHSYVYRVPRYDYYVAPAPWYYYERRRYHYDDDDDWDDDWDD